MVLFASDSVVMLVVIVTIFTSKPAITFDGVVGVGVGTDARHTRPILARPNERTEETLTLFNVAVVVAIDITCVDGV